MKALIAALVVAVATASFAQQAPATSLQPAPPGQHLHDADVARLFNRPLPGLSERRATPRATGQAGADARIRDIALSRGYQRRGEPLDPTGTYQGRSLQPRAIADLADLQAAMANDIGATLTLTSAQRGAVRQRSLFLAQLRTSSLSLRGRMVTNSEIAAGRADDVLHHAMRIAAPPGFSRHHTGLAIDVASEGLGSFAFANSRAYNWLTGNQYENAMRYGWIPSYPPGAAAQGPNPEPWEWVWIGRDSAECARSFSCARGALNSVTGRAAGWAITPDGTRPDSFRLLTSSGTEPLNASNVGRFDVAIAYGLDNELVGFEAAGLLPPDSSWACVEAQSSADGPWNPIGCLDLE